MSADDTRILEEALRVMSRSLNDLVGACTGHDGKPRAPKRGTLLKAQATLPPSCSWALSRKAAPLPPRTQSTLRITSHDDKSLD